jgi:GTP-binding protein HflX
LTDAGVLAEDKLFATLDPTTRRIELPGGRSVLMTDTVGFINNLPTMLIAAFRATLEEINEATLLVHVVDVTHPQAVEQFATVNDVLEELGADGKPTIIALNKSDQIDSVSDEDMARLRETIGDEYPVVTVSGITGFGMEALLGEIELALESEQRFVDVELVVPFSRHDLVDRFHSTGRVEGTSYDERGTVLTGKLPEAQLSGFAPYVSVVGTGEAPVAVEDRGAVA